VTWRKGKEGRVITETERMKYGKQDKRKDKEANEDGRKEANIWKALTLIMF
jgi:hypothetical protein